eukprot:jgi/Psemu1/306429/fgenesh1_kg.257_\
MAFYGYCPNSINEYQLGESIGMQIDSAKDRMQELVLVASSQAFQFQRLIQNFMSCHNTLYQRRSKVQLVWIMTFEEVEVGLLSERLPTSCYSVESFSIVW